MRQLLIGLVLAGAVQILPNGFGDGVDIYQDNKVYQALPNGFGSYTIYPPLDLSGEKEMGQEQEWPLGTKQPWGIPSNQRGAESGQNNQ